MLVRLCRLGQIACLLMSLSGFILIIASPPAVQAQGACQSVCSGENADFGACAWCERLEHGTGSGGMAAGSALTLTGLLGAISLGQLCHGLEQGAGGAAGDGGGGGGRREEGASLGDAAGMVSFLAGLGLTNADGTPINPESLSSELNRYWKMGVPPPTMGEGSGEKIAGTGDARPGPASAEASDRWQLLGADAEGRVYDANGQHILNIDADGKVTDLRGSPVREVQRGGSTPQEITSYIDADGNEIRPGYGTGLQRVETDAEGRQRYHQTDLPEPRGPTLDPEIGAKWRAVGAGINGELYSPDGRILGRIDSDGNMFTADGRPISGSSFAEDGRLRWFNTDDGQHWAWSEDGTYKSSQLPDGEPFRPRSREEWDRIDRQRAPTQVDSGDVSSDRPVGPGTLVDGEEGGRHISDDLAQRLRAGTGRPGTRAEPGAGETRVPSGADTRVYGEEPGGRPPPSGAQQPRSGTTQVDDGGGGGAAPGARTQVEGGESRPVATGGDAEGGKAPAAAGGGADAEPARAGGTDAATTRAGGTDVEGRAPRPSGVEAEAQGTRSGFSTALNIGMDVKNVEQLYNQHIADGKSPAEAFTLAVAQTVGGDIASATGRVNAMGAGALLPGGLANLTPEKAVESYIGTGYDTLVALSRTAGESAAAGRLDTTTLDNFAEAVANKPNADPFAGYGQIGRLIGEESARTDGGNLWSDLQHISRTGAGEEVLNESMSQFQQQAESGAFGSPLQGINYLTQAAAEVVADPGTTIGQFFSDVKNMYDYGVGDGFWNEALDQTVGVIEKTPVANVIYDGYHQVFSGIAEQGLGTFTSEMAEGASALASEAYRASADAITDAAGATYNYIRSWF